MTAERVPRCDPRLEPGAILIIEASDEVSDRLVPHLVSERARPVLVASCVEEVAPLLASRPARPHLAGAVVSGSLGRDRARAPVPWLELAYPQTPIAIIPSDVREASLPRLVRTWFDPWDREVIARRRLLLRWAGAGEERLREHLLRTLDATLEDVPRNRLPLVRGLSADSSRRYVWEIEDLFRVADLDELRLRWLRHQRRRIVRWGAAVRRPRRFERVLDRTVRLG